MHNTLSSRSFAFARAILVAGSVIATGAVLGCSSKDKEDGTSSTQRPIEVCETQLEGKCGDTCQSTDDCDPGQFCSSKKCTAECTQTLGCNGTCTADGHCDGTRQMQAVMEDTNEGDVLINDGNDVESGNFETCATGQTSGMITPVVMYVMFDRSSSMNEASPEGATTTRWDRATEGLIKFFQDPASAKMSVAYGVYPTDEGGCDQNECNAAACGEEVVTLGTLTADGAPGDAQEAALVQAITDDDARVESGLGTPTGAALQGALAWATQYQGAHADETAVVVLVTDGEPNGCGDTREIENIVSSARGTGGIRTYAIGLDGLEGPNQDTLNAIAQAGGTGEGIFIGQGDVTNDLLAAFNAIRGDIGSCNVQIPQEGDSDPNKVNVTLTLADGPIDIARVMTEDDCADNAAWYYDDNNDPNQLLLCPATCEVVQADTNPSIEIVLGCPQTLVPAPITR